MQEIGGGRIEHGEISGGGRRTGPDDLLDAVVTIKVRIANIATLGEVLEGFGRTPELRHADRRALEAWREFVREAIREEGLLGLAEDGCAFGVGGPAPEDIVSIEPVIREYRPWPPVTFEGEPL